MRQPITIDTLLNKPDLVMQQLEKRGEWTAPSEIYNTGYCAKNGHLVILRGKDGAVAIKTSEVRKLAKELMEYAEILEYRKDARIKGA
jgi:hypothetical protein